MTKIITRPGDKGDQIVVDEQFRQMLYVRDIALESDDVWLDIGGHIGTFAVAIAPWVKAVYVFEPEQENYNLLLQNIALYGYKHIHPFQQAVAAQNGVRVLYLGDQSITHTLTPIRGRKKQGVQCSGINEIIAAYAITKIKLDAEGIEDELLPAITCWNSLQEIVLEWHTWMLGGKHQQKYARLEAFLRQHYERVRMGKVTRYKTAIIYAGGPKDIPAGVRLQWE